MRQILVVLVSCFFCVYASAQMPRGGFGNRGGQQVAGRFYGKVVDAANKGIEAASVTLVQKRMDSATKQAKEVVVGGMLTTNKGDFSIENVPAFGRYTLRVTGIGYAPYEQQVSFPMPNRNGAGNNGDPSNMLTALDKDLGNIKLKVDNKTLSDVTVTASKPLVQMGIDRKIFNVEKNIVSAGGTAVDVMRNVPSLNVDIDGNITLRNAAPQLFVDGRPTTLTLDQIPADAIESVEVITNPSAKFDASGGTAGILNIVLKKNKRVGYSGNVRANVDSRGRLGAGADINIRQNKVNFFASANFNQRKSVSTGTTTRENLVGVPSNSAQYDNTTQGGNFGFGRAGFDFLLDNRNTITISGTMAKGKMSPFTNSDIYIDSTFRTANGDSLVQWHDPRTSTSTRNFQHSGAQFSYKHNFPKNGHELTADVNYQTAKNDNSNLITTDYYQTLPNKGYDHTYNQLQLSNGNNSTLIAQTDYTNPLTDNSKLELGARAQIRKTNSATDYMSLLPGGLVYHLPGQNIIYNSQDNVYAAYATYSNRIKNFGYQLGLRAESSSYTGTSNISKYESFNINFPLSLFPSVFLTQKINDDDQLQLNYSRRINRPNFWQLFPFTDYTDSLNITRGNPTLHPEFTNSLELSYAKTFKNRDNLIASVYFKNTNSLITSFQTREIDTTYSKNPILVNTYVNANRSYIGGLELISRNKITKWWELTSNFNLFTAKIMLDTLPNPNQLVSYFVKINNTFRLPKNFSIQLSGDYQSKIIASPNGNGGGRFGGGFGGSTTSSQGYIRPFYGVDAAVRYDFLKNKTASLTLNINDIFRTRKYDMHIESPYSIQDVMRQRDPQLVRLNFSYRFGKFDANLFKRKDNKLDNNDISPDVNMKP